MIVLKLSISALVGEQSCSSSIILPFLYILDRQIDKMPIDKLKQQNYKRNTLESACGNKFR